MNALPTLTSALYWPNLLDYKLEAALWVIFSIGLYALGVDLAWHYRRPRSGRLGQRAKTLKQWPHRHWLLEPIKFLYYIGIPYAALLRGAILPRLMGLTHLDWVKGMGLGAALGGAAFLLLAVVWWWYVRAVDALPRWVSARREVSSADASTNGCTRLREAIYLETHWAFYRSAAILLLESHYAGAFIGFLLVTLEWSTNPAWRRDLTLPWRSANLLLRWSLAFATAIIFLFTRNLWLLAPIHWAIESVTHRLLASSRQRKNSESAGLADRVA